MTVRCVGFLTLSGDLRRFWETVRHLKAGQVLHRAWFRLYRPWPDFRPPPATRQLLGAWITPACRESSMTGPTKFLFMNRVGDLADLTWDGDETEKLWRYNQHYFDDINAIGANARRSWHAALIERWIAENPPGSGTAWEPYPTSLRIVNWVKWIMAGNEAPPDFWESLAVQIRWLSKRLERHLLGNHLVANGKALVFGGTLFGGNEGDNWRRTGLRILRYELSQQILLDGGHFELSPMYHALALEDVLDVINILRAGMAPDEWVNAFEELIPSMQTWLDAMSHPDGDIAFFNDAAIGVAPALRELAQYAQRLGFPAVPKKNAAMWLKYSGYARVALADAVLIADMADVGPPYLPGHAHADTLSFELSLGSERILVNSGTSLYGASEERLRQRGTAAHNCVVVDGRNSSDVWSGFRVGKRARPISPSVVMGEKTTTLRAGHDGYRSLPNAPVHWREWTISANTLKVEDEISNPGLSAKAYFHLHPDVAIEMTDSRGGALLLPNGRRLVWRASCLACCLLPSSWHPKFGVTRVSRSIVLSLRKGRSTLTLDWR